MPFKSESQRKWMWANKPEMAKHWQSVTPKGKHLPEHVKNAALHKKSEEAAHVIMEKLSARKKQNTGIGGWVKEHPVATAGMAALPVAGGMVARNLLRKPTAYGTLSKSLQQQARKQGIGIQFSAATHSQKGAPTLLEKAKAFIQTGGGAKPIWTTSKSIDRPLEMSRKHLNEGRVTSGLDAPKGAKQTKDLVYHYGQPDAPARSIRQNLQKLIRGGKVMEASKETGLQNAFETTMSAHQLATKHGLKVPSAKASMEERMTFLTNLQAAAKKEFARSPTKDFLLKPHDVSSSAGYFPHSRGDWAKRYKKYNQGMKQDMEWLMQDAKKNPQKYGGEDPVNVAVEMNRHHPAFSGFIFDNMFKAPRKAAFQAKSKVVKVPKIFGDEIAEYRVHSIGGDVPRELVYNRNAPILHQLQRMPLIKHLIPGRVGSQQGAQEYIQKQVLPKLNKKYRKGTYGFDVMRVQNPDGSHGYKLVEMNPAGQGYMSGYLDPQKTWVPGHDIYKYLTGKDTPLLSGMKAVAAGGTAGAVPLTYTGLKKKREEPSSLRRRPKRQ